jgi:drug/metabolite transporter (DMT)-like permease
VIVRGISPIDPNRSWLPGYLLLATIWGASFLLIKVGVRELPPADVTLGRSAAGAVTLLVLLAAMRKPLPRDLRIWGHFCAAAALGVVVPFTLFGYAEQRIPSLLAAIWNSVTPLLTLPVAVWIFRTERMRPDRAAGLLIGFIGVLFVLRVWDAPDSASLVGQLMCAAGVVCFSLAIPYQRRFLAQLPVDSIVIATGQLLAATVQLVALILMLPEPLPDLAHLSGAVIASVAVLGVLGTGIAFVLNFRVIRLAGATTAVSVTYLIPIVATVLGVVLLSEDLEWQEPIGAGIVLLGVYVGQRSQPERTPRRAEPGAVATRRPR